MTDSFTSPAPKPILLRFAPLSLLFFALLPLWMGGSIFLTRGQGAISEKLGLAQASAAAQFSASLALLGMGGGLVAAAWGFRSGRLWARPLTVGLFVALVLASPLLLSAGSAGVGGALGALFGGAVWVIFLVDYLYDAPDVVAYHARLESERDTAGAEGVRPPER